LECTVKKKDLVRLDLKILMILSNPFMVDPRVYKEAKALVDAGYEVSVIVWDRKKTYEKQDTIDGIRLFRIHNEGLMTILSHDLFRNPLWWWHAYKKGLELYNDGFDFDVVHCHDLDTLASGVLLKQKLGVKLVYDAHEMWGYLIEGSVPKIVSKIAFIMEKILVKKVDSIITVSKPFFDYFSSIAKCSVTLVMNCKDLSYKEYKPANNKNFTLIYIGGMKKKRFFPEIIDLCTKIDNVHLILAGKPEDLFNEIKKYANDFDNVNFHGTIPTKDILPLTRKADATFILVDPSSKHYQKTLFNKQFEAMVCARPIIVTNDTYAAEMTKELNCGISVDYTEESIRKAIIKLRDNPGLCESLGKNGFTAAKKRYNWEIEKKNLLKVYERL
jgi:glycosyltransferase involved in cell wall biosynthesis